MRQLAICLLFAVKVRGFELGFGSRRLVQPTPKNPLEGLDAHLALESRHARVAVLAAVRYPLQQQPLWHTVAVLVGLAQTPDTTQGLVSRIAFLSATAGVVRDFAKQAGLFLPTRQRRKRKNDRARGLLNDDVGRALRPPKPDNIRGVFAPLTNTK